MSDQYLSDKDYKYLIPAEKARLWKIHKKRTGGDSNPSPHPSMINQVKINISEFKFTLRYLKRGMDPNEEDNLFSDDDDNIKVNARNSTLNTHPPSGNSRNNGGV